MQAFYRGIFIEKDGNKAMKMLNAARSRSDKGTFDIFNCEKLFIDVWNGYLEQFTQPGADEARVERMMENGRTVFESCRPRKPSAPAHACPAR